MLHSGRCPPPTAVWSRLRQQLAAGGDHIYLVSGYRYCVSQSKKISPNTQSTPVLANTRYANTSIIRTLLIVKGRSKWALITLFVVDRISQNFFGSTHKGSFSSTPFRSCRYLHRFQRYLRSNSKVVVKRTKFLTFFALPNFKGGGAPKLRTCVNTPT